jgi:hypothetical protein
MLDSVGVTNEFRPNAAVRADSGMPACRRCQTRSGGLTGQPLSAVKMGEHFGEPIVDGGLTA